MREPNVEELLQKLGKDAVPVDSERRVLLGVRVGVARRRRQVWVRSGAAVAAALLLAWAWTAGRQVERQATQLAKSMDAPAAPQFARTGEPPLARPAILRKSKPRHAVAQPRQVRFMADASEPAEAKPGLHIVTEDPSVVLILFE